MATIEFPSHPRASRRALFALPVLAAAGYLCLCAWFWVHQRDFLYAPGGTAATPAEVGLTHFSVVKIATQDGERIIGWWKPPPHVGDGVVLYFRGTPSTLPDYAPYVMPDIENAGLGALAIDYRGFGGSTGSPSEDGIKLDARAAFDFIRGQAPQSKVALFGQSFGTGPAVTLATERPVSGVLLNAPYASFLRLFKLGAPPILPYGWLLTDQYNSEATISRVKVPVFILYGSADDTIPHSEVLRLYAAANQPKTIIQVEGADHTQAWRGAAKARALEALTAWTH